MAVVTPKDEKETYGLCGLMNLWCGGGGFPLILELEVLLMSHCTEVVKTSLNPHPECI